MGERQFTAEEFFAELDDVGEQQVRNRLIAGNYGAENHPKYKLAVDWLAKLERSRASKAEIENRRIANSSKNAAWVGIFVSVLALIVATVALLKAW